MCLNHKVMWTRSLMPALDKHPDKRNNEKSGTLFLLKVNPGEELVVFFFPQTNVCLYVFFPLTIDLSTYKEYIKRTDVGYRIKLEVILCFSFCQRI